ncbi:MAG: hypothetical protein R2883_08720 [Caldisericia bacterium]
MIKRNTIVHPSVDISERWSPPLIADDYFEYFDAARMLLVYIITDKVIDIEDFTFVLE